MGEWVSEGSGGGETVKFLNQFRKPTRRNFKGNGKLINNPFIFFGNPFTFFRILFLSWSEKEKVWYEIKSCY